MEQNVSSSSAQSLCGVLTECLVTNLWSTLWTPAPVWQLCRRTFLPAPLCNACSSHWKDIWEMELTTENKYWFVFNSQIPNDLLWGFSSSDRCIGYCGDAVTHRMFSMLRGLMKIAIGWRPANWRRFIAFPDTSSIQCLPWNKDRDYGPCLPLKPPSAPLLLCVSPCQPLLWQTVCWYHTGGCYTGQPQWTYALGSLAPWALWRTWSGSLCRWPRNLDVAELYLRDQRFIFWFGWSSRMDVKNPGFKRTRNRKFTSIWALCRFLGKTLS